MTSIPKGRIIAAGKCLLLKETICVQFPEMALRLILSFLWIVPHVTHDQKTRKARIKELIRFPARVLEQEKEEKG